MNLIIKKSIAIILVFLVTVMTSCKKSDKASPKNIWNELNQTEITSEMGLGWNLGNQLEASKAGIPGETVWGNPIITKELIEKVKEQGFKTVRIPVSYLDKIGPSPEYTIEKEWLNRIQEVVDYVIDNDMYAVVNMHGDGYYTVENSWLLCVEDEEQQKVIKAKYEIVWAQIAERFRDYDQHLIFESMNEEFDNTYGLPNAYGYQNLNEYNQIFVNTIRKTGSNNEKRWLLIPGWNTNIEYTAGNYGFAIPKDDHCKVEENRLMISVHFYDPYNFTLDENKNSAKTQWGKYAIENYDDWGQEDHIDIQMALLNDKFVSKGYPVIIGEMGVQDKAVLSKDFAKFRCYWHEYVIKEAKENGCICVYWDNGWNDKFGFGLFNRISLETTQPSLIKAMMRAINAKDNYKIPLPKDIEI